MAQAEAEAEAQAQAQQQVEPQEDMAVITQSGSKYHRPGCRTLNRSKSTSTVTRSDAESRGFVPCGVCHP